MAIMALVGAGFSYVAAGDQSGKMKPTGAGVTGQSSPKAAIPTVAGAKTVAGASATPTRTASPSPTPRPATPRPRAAAGTGTAAKLTATPKPAAPDIAPVAVCPGQTDKAQAATAIACLTNFARRYHKLGAVTNNAVLTAAAAAKAQDIAKCQFSHTACGRDVTYWLRVKGYAGLCSAENIAQGQATPRDVFISWMNSPGHRGNILNPRYTKVGAAVVAATGGPAWVMELGGCP